MKDGEVLTTSRRLKLDFAETGWCSLTIANCSSSDTGIYLCSASNANGVEGTQAMLTIAEESGKDKHLVTAEDRVESEPTRPKFVRAPEQTVEIAEGAQLKLVGKAIGRPTPRMIWKKDEKEISRTNRAYEIRVTGDGESVLIAECAVAKTAGLFTCTAENSEGVETVESHVIVTKC